jgi:transcriptional regulator with XRE-family HTH domain
MNINKIFSTNLIRLRKLKGLSQRKLADKTGLTQRIINSYENNPEYIPLEKINILADALDVPITFLFETNKTEKNKIIDDLDVRWINKIKEIKGLSDSDQKEIMKHINYLIERNFNKKNKISVDQS